MAPPPKVLIGSLGFAVKNKKPDVALTQAMLNAFPATRGGTMPALNKDRPYGPITVAAIRRFQQLNQYQADARIDPGMSTEKVRLALPDALGTLADLLGPGAATAAGPSAPLMTAPAGPGTPVPRRYVACARHWNRLRLSRLIA